VASNRHLNRLNKDHGVFCDCDFCCTLLLDMPFPIACPMGVDAAEGSMPGTLLGTRSVSPPGYKECRSRKKKQSTLGNSKSTHLFQSAYVQCCQHPFEKPICIVSSASRLGGYFCCACFSTHFFRLCQRASGLGGACLFHHQCTE
jgi:hypothetical protein